MNVKPCPVSGCGALIRSSAVMCSEDWKRLPADMQYPIFYLRGVEVMADLYREALGYLNTLGPLPPVETRAEARYA